MNIRRGKGHERSILTRKNTGKNIKIMMFSHMWRIRFIGRVLQYKKTSL